MWRFLSRQPFPSPSSLPLRPRLQPPPAKSLPFPSWLFHPSYQSPLRKNRSGSTVQSAREPSVTATGTPRTVAFWFWQLLPQQMLAVWSTRGEALEKYVNNYPFLLWAITFSISDRPTRLLSSCLWHLIWTWWSAMSYHWILVIPEWLEYPFHTSAAQRRYCIFEQCSLQTIQNAYIQKRRYCPANG